MAIDDTKIQQVWEKGTIVPGVDSTKWRKDACGAWIGRSFRDRESPYSWEIDHIDPEKGDELSNLRPLQWVNNLEKSDERLKCNITSNGNENVRKR